MMAAKWINQLDWQYQDLVKLARGTNIRDNFVFLEEHYQLTTTAPLANAAAIVVFNQNSKRNFHLPCSGHGFFVRVGTNWPDNILSP